MPPQKRLRMATETDTLPSTSGGGCDAAGAQKRAGYPAAAGVVSTRYFIFVNHVAHLEPMLILGECTGC